MKTLSRLAAAVAAALSLAMLPAVADAQRAGGGYYRGGPPAGGYQGGYQGGYHGGYRGGWVGGGWRPYWGPAWGGWGWGAGWRGWGPGWGGWGWGVGWYPGWWGFGGPGYWGWSAGAPIIVAPGVSGAWVLPPSATTYIERDADATSMQAPAQAPQQQWWYWCESAKAYYPYVESCAEGWQRVEPRTPRGTP
jgi:hypothetical protein